jgi:cobalt/nickel transport system ATP-binding protein
MSEPVLETDSIVFAYPCGKPGLKGLSVRVERHAKLAIIGPNGAGKSTLFLCLNGIYRPQRGAIRLEGAAVAYHRNALRDWRRRVGLLFQDPDDQVVAPGVLQDVAFGPLNLGLDGGAARLRAEQALTSLGLEALADSATHELSYGQKRMVALAGVLAMRPDVILLDEPTSGLDPVGKRRALAVLNQLHAAGATLVMSTHDMDLAHAWADDVAVVKDGMTLAQGAPRAIFGDAALIEAAGLELPRPCNS